jgi:hypothetical protein
MTCFPHMGVCHMGADLKLVAPQDDDTVEVLQKLLKQASRGEIIGFAYVALRPGCDYSGDVVGVARSSEIITRGVVSTLWDQIPRLTKK